jgi:hypothetical protein
MRLVTLIGLLVASAGAAEEPALSAEWCAARHQKLVTVDRKAIVVLDSWDAARRAAQLTQPSVLHRKTAEGATAMARLSEIGEQTAKDAARCTQAGFRNTRAQRLAYRRNEMNFHRVEPILAALQDAWTALQEAERATLMAEIKKSGLLETL